MVWNRTTPPALSAFERALTVAEVIPFPVEYSQRHTVLVVDDEPAIRGVLCEFLRECGFNSLSAENADQAMTLIAGGSAVDLVFSDVRMPGTMDGCGLARWILQNRPELPVILATGDLGKANAAAGLSGVETFAKPYDFDAAVRKIRDTIFRRKQRAS
jgi:DNA-binding NtrC family response regulator